MIAIEQHILDEPIMAGFGGTQIPNISVAAEASNRASRGLNESKD